MGEQLRNTALWAICSLLMLSAVLLAPTTAWAAPTRPITVDVSLEGKRDVTLEPEQSRVIRLINVAEGEVKIRFLDIPKELNLKFTDSRVNPTGVRGQAVKDARTYKITEELKLEAKVATSKTAVLTLVSGIVESQCDISLAWRKAPVALPKPKAKKDVDAKADARAKAKKDAEAKAATTRTLVCLGVLFLLLVGVGIAAWTLLNQHRASGRHAQLPSAAADALSSTLGSTTADSQVTAVRRDMGPQSEDTAPESEKPGGPDADSPLTPRVERRIIMLLDKLGYAGPDLLGEFPEEERPAILEAFFEKHYEDMPIVLKGSTIVAPLGESRQEDGQPTEK